MVVIRPREATHFVELTSTKLVGVAVNDATRMADPSLVLGEAGTGKSIALLHYAAEHGAIYCHASHTCKTVRGMYEMLLASAGYYNERTFTRDLASIVYSRFDSWGSARGKMLIVDEVQNLGLDAMRELLNVHETCRLRTVLAGNDKRLAQTKTHDSALDQIISRLGTRVRLSKPLPEDCRSLIEAFGVTDANAVFALSAFGQRTSLRDLVRILEMALGGASAVALRHVEQAVLSVHFGDRKALKLLEAA